LDQEGIIALLNEDLKDEHGAISQYLNHAYAMGECEMACEIEAIAREEMRHLDLLAEAIVELGGVPGLERGAMIGDRSAVADWMAADATREEGAITKYREHIRLIDEPQIKRLLERILSDKLAHRLEFSHFVDKAGRDKLTDHRGEASGVTIDNLNWGIKHEYTVIPQYLLQSCVTGSEAARRELQDQATNEMQHMGWLAAKIMDKGGRPHLEHSRVDRHLDTATGLMADIAIEHEVAARYDRDGTADPDGKREASATPPARPRGLPRRGLRRPAKQNERRGTLKWRIPRPTSRNSRV
jgi:bacterioferritin